MKIFLYVNANDRLSTVRSKCDVDSRKEEKDLKFQFFIRQVM